MRVRRGGIGVLGGRWVHRWIVRGGRKRGGGGEGMVGAGGCDDGRRWGEGEAGGCGWVGCR